jgi:Ca2+/Na+ antiporter
LNKIQPYIKRFGFACVIVFTALIPYGIRCMYYYFHKEDLPLFYRSDNDLLAYSIAISLALIVENKGNYSPWRTMYTIVLILVPAFCFFYSLSLEDSYLQIEEDIVHSIHTKTDLPILIMNRFEKYYVQREKLYWTSGYLSLGLTIICFILIVFKKEEQ